MVSSLVMKTLLVIAFVALNAVIISGLDLKPNLRLSFSSISKGPSIEYTILPYEFRNLALSPLHSMLDFDIILKATKYGTIQDLWWSIHMSSNWNNRKFKNCDHLNFSIREQFQQSNENHSMFHEGIKLEALNVFTANLKMKQILALHGCKNTNKNDKMHLNKIIIAIYKYGEAFELKIWNTTFLIHQKMFGYVQIMNEEIEGRTNEVKSDVFTNLTQYCHDLAGITNAKKNYNFHYKSESESKNQLLTWIRYGVLILIIVIIIVFVLFTCFECKICICN